MPGCPCYPDLTFIIRIDRPGTLATDYHTTGGGYPRHQQLHTSSGTRRPANESTLPTHRSYLHDAVFTIAATGPAPLLGRIVTDLEHPRWAPYLGRRCCTPTEPLVLGAPTPDPLQRLRRHVPLSLARPPHPDAATVPVTFVWETPPAAAPARAHHELADDPEDLTPDSRRYRARPLWQTTEHLPATLYAGPHPLRALVAYLKEQP
ncbi:type I-E CRISPR-associated protein Cas5/CasD [Streptomyces sp. CA-132043]|uniref:type I-E CRISPR-associated protein Cas5/CasD n=1 Tax=Streptomyces sp. CA-132043 TaxID=3240048 RepID=UPI003D92EFA6